MDVYPFKPGDWVSNDRDDIARVKNVWNDGNEVLLDLIIYAHDGTKLGRTSPPCGGPRSFEPACSSENWERIAEPTFPIHLQWIPTEDGSQRSRFWAGPRLAPLQWTKPQRRSVTTSTRSNDEFRHALELIAAGHNDPRTVAKEALDRRR